MKKARLKSLSKQEKVVNAKILFTNYFTEKKWNDEFNMIFCIQKTFIHSSTENKNSWMISHLKVFFNLYVVPFSVYEQLWMHLGIFRVFLLIFSIFYLFISYSFCFCSNAFTSGATERQTRVHWSKSFAVNFASASQKEKKMANFSDWNRFVHRLMDKE